MAEPIYIALQLFGYEGDAHKFVNEVLLPQAKDRQTDLADMLMLISYDDPKLKKVVEAMPSEAYESLFHPEKYTGKSEETALRIATDIEEQINTQEYRAQ